MDIEDKEKEIEKLKKQIEALKKQITLYEISTKWDYQKIQRLKEANIKEKKILKYLNI